MTPTEKIDAALDSVLRASGSSIKMFRNEIILEGMREAMRKIMMDSYIEGSNDAHDQMAQIMR